MAEAVIRSDNHGPGADLLVNEIVDEVVGRYLGEIHGKLDNYKNINAGGFDELQLLLMRGYEWWSIRWIKHLDGMGVESYDNGFSIQRFGNFLDALKEANVSNMDTIKVADCDHGIAKRARNFVYTIKHFHMNSVDLQLPVVVEIKGGILRLDK